MKARLQHREYGRLSCWHSERLHAGAAWRIERRKQESERRAIRRISTKAGAAIKYIDKDKQQSGDPSGGRPDKERPGFHLHRLDSPVQGVRAHQTQAAGAFLISCKPQKDFQSSTSGS